MTEQQRCDSMAEAMVPYSSTRMDPEHADKLKEMMRHSTDPRWVERQLSAPPVEQARPFPWGIVIVAIIGIGFSLAMLGYAYAAERSPAFEIVAYPAGKDLREDRPNIIVIAGPYAGREECRIAIASVKLANGSRLRCDRIEDRRTR